MNPGGAAKSNDVAHLSGLQPGEVVAGRYRVERLLGRGGMGVVVSAHHLQLDEKVALKLLLPAALQDAEAVERFMREARATVKIKSEHVARVLDVGQIENGSPYMVMEYLDGSDLRHWLKQRGALSVEQAVDFVMQASEAIAEAHSLGIIHRDLKPANLFCIRRPDGQLSIKVLDFGVSKMTTPGADGHDMTSTTAVVGTPSYMSPEQLQSSRGVDVRTDIWSLGVILFELLTQRLPFESKYSTELVIKIAVEAPPFATSLRSDVPIALSQIIARCLDKDRDRRFPSIAEFARAMQPFASRSAQSGVERIAKTLGAQVAAMTGSSASTGTLVMALPAALAAQLLGPTTNNSSIQLRSTSQLKSTAQATNAPWGQATPPAQAEPRKSDPKVFWFAATALMIIAGVGGGALAAKPWAKRDTGANPGTSAAAPTETSTVPPLSPPPPPVPDPRTAPATDPTIASPDTSSKPKSNATWKGLKTVGPNNGPPPTTVTGSGVRPGCEVNFTLDAEGNKHFKPECFLKR